MPAPLCERVFACVCVRANRMSDVREKLHSQFIDKIQGLLLRFWLPRRWRQFVIASATPKACGNWKWKFDWNRRERVQSEIEYPKRLIYLYSPLHGDLCAENSSACSGRQHMRIRSVVRPVRVAYIDCCQAHMECVYQETIFPVFIKFKNSTWGHRIHRIYTMLIYNNMLYLEYWNMRCC